jgi:N-acetylneuraminic acid mutarotase
MRVRSVGSATCALLLLAAPALASGPGSGSLRAGAGPVTPQRSVVSTAAGSWTATASMATARAHLTATQLGNGRVLVVGGVDEATTELYNPATGTWTATGPMVNPLVGGSAVALLPNGQVLNVGGERLASCTPKQCSSEPSATAELYTP